MGFPYNYYEAIEIDPTRDLYEGVKVYLSSGKEGDIKRLFLDYYLENLSIEQLAVQYPELMRGVEDGKAIDALAKKSFIEDLGQEKLNIYGDNLASYMQVLAERNDYTAWLEEQIKELERQLQSVKERNRELEEALEGKRE